LLDDSFAALDALTRIRMHGLVHQLLRRHSPGVVLVTHDIDEAMSLSDRVVVLNEGRVRLDVLVEVPGPRARTDRAFEHLRQRLLAELGVVTDEPPGPCGGPRNRAAQAREAEAYHRTVKF
jgi:sulfonate transport system ATP-binding protein